MPNRRGIRLATRSTTRSAVASGSSAGNRKKSGCSPNAGGWPALIRCALTTTPDCWACRKIWVSRTRGMVSAASTSRSTSPAPTEGSWSTSPTSSRCAPGGTALISLLARIRSSMLASSTTIRSASSGWSRSKLGSPPGRSCSSRCTVVAGCPDSSVNRFAARPVGAASTIFARFAAANVITDLTVNDFPQPGPPVSTATRCVSANRTACSCSAANSAPVRARSQANALAQSTVREGRHPIRRRGGQPQQRGGQRGLGPVERHQIHRRDRPAARCSGTGSRITPSAAAAHPGRCGPGRAGTPRICAASVSRFGSGR